MIYVYRMCVYYRCCRLVLMHLYQQHYRMMIIWFVVVFVVFQFCVCIFRCRKQFVLMVYLQVYVN
jgi:hypothetical protein